MKMPTLLARPATAHRAPDPLQPATLAGPDAVQITARHLMVGDSYAASLIVTGYPAEVAAGWLEPLLTYPARLDLALHVDPIDPVTASTKLRRQRARLESGRRADADRGRLADPETDAAAERCRRPCLPARPRRGEAVPGRAVPDGPRPKRAATSAGSRRRASAGRLTADHHRAHHVPGATGVDDVPAAGRGRHGATRTFDTAALAAAFPFTSPDLPRRHRPTPCLPPGCCTG